MNGEGPGLSGAVTVTDESSQLAAMRLAEEHSPCVLSFASARNVGGGFIKGAKAQEEDIHRCCGIYRCLEPIVEYYRTNRNQDSMLYTDHIIYSPSVPWFRVDGKTLLDKSFEASIITAPAPNAGEHLRRNPDDYPSIHKVIRRRSGYILAIAAANRETHLVLGAWGCGVFQNDPEGVAESFHSWLYEYNLKRYFEHVRFAVLDKTEGQPVLSAFRDTYAP